MRTNRSFHRGRLPALIVPVLLCTLILAGRALAYGGVLDPTFDGDGRLVTDLGGGGSITALVLQPDGKIVVAGSHEQGVALVRYNPDGSPDLTFGGGGSVVHGGLGVSVYALALQPDGKIVATGRYHTGRPYDDDLALVRFHSDGSPDTGFGAAGRVTTDFSLGGFLVTDDSGTAVAVQPDGKIVVAGNGLCSSCPAVDVVLARYNGDGSLDASFGGDGRVEPAFFSGRRDAFALALQPDGKVLIAGSDQAGNLNIMVARYNGDGSPDTAFDLDGEARADFGDNAVGYDLALQPDGKIVAAGYLFIDRFPDFDYDFALARFEAGGSPDLTFGTDGKVTTDFGSRGDLGTAVGLLSDGRIVMSGQSESALNVDFALARYLGDGSLDTTFDDDGRLTTDFNNGADLHTALAVQPDDRIVVAGTSDGDFALARYADHAFADVLPGYWSWDYVESLYAAGITGGCGTNPLMYCPEETVTRAQMAVLLGRGVHGSAYNPPAAGSSTGFGDVPPTYWAAAWIKQLAAEGITGGCAAGAYCPEAPVTRAQMAVLLLRSKHGASYTPPAVGSSTGFSDVPPGYWAAAWIEQLVAEGITGGCGAGTYCPESPVTRAQMAVFLVRTFNLP